MDTLNPVRPYLRDRRHLAPPTRESLEQAHRRWALDMLARGIDVGPTTIHGVHLIRGSRTIHLTPAA